MNFLVPGVQVKNLVTQITRKQIQYLFIRYIRNANLKKLAVHLLVNGKFPVPAVDDLRQDRINNVRKGVVLRYLNDVEVERICQFQDVCRDRVHKSAYFDPQGSDFPGIQIADQFPEFFNAAHQGKAGCDQELSALHPSLDIRCVHHRNGGNFFTKFCVCQQRKIRKSFQQVSDCEHRHLPFQSQFHPGDEFTNKHTRSRTL